MRGIDGLADLNVFLADGDDVDLGRQAGDPDAFARVLQDGHGVERDLAVLDRAHAEHAIVVERQHRLRQQVRRRGADIDHGLGGDAVDAPCHRHSGSRSRSRNERVAGSAVEEM